MSELLGTSSAFKRGVVADTQDCEYRLIGNKLRKRIKLRKYLKAHPGLSDDMKIDFQKEIVRIGRKLNEAGADNRKIKEDQAYPFWTKKIQSSKIRLIAFPTWERLKRKKKLI